MSYVDGILEEGGYVKLYRQREWGPKFSRENGRGKVLAHLGDHVGKSVTIGRIAGISGWQHPVDEMRDLAKTVNSWVTSHRMEPIKSGGRVTHYRIRARRGTSVLCS